MMNLIRAELFKITRSVPLLLLTLAAIAVNVFLSSRSKVELTDLYGLPELSSVSVFVSYFEERDMSASSAKAMMAKRGYLDPEESRAETLIEVFEDIQPHQFKLVLSSVKGLLLLPLLLLYLYILRDFRTRSYLNALYTGRSRAEVYFSKAATFISVSFIVSFISVLLLALSYANTVFSRLPAGYVWGRCLLCALLDTAVLAVPFMLAFALRRPPLVVTAAMIYSLAVRFSPGLVWPAAAKSGIELWSQNATSGLIGNAVLSAAVFIAASLLIGWLAFERADLK